MKGMWLSRLVTTCLRELRILLMLGERFPGLILLFLSTVWALKAQTLVFDPNPVNALNNTELVDSNDANDAVDIAAYSSVVLSRLDPPVDGSYQLRGDFVLMADIESPNNTVPTSSSEVFRYLREDDRFEEVMCYFHITRNQEYIQSLGFFDINNRVQAVDAHGLRGSDQSRYVGRPVGAGYLAFGDGGVDDAEDADLILHEYGHSIQDNSSNGRYFGTGNAGFGNETGAMGEGFCDYWAASCSYDQSVASGYDPAAVAEWDRVPYLRRVDRSKRYPAEMVGQVHADGEIWSACLWELFHLIGKRKTDRIVLQSHFLVPDDPLFEDGARALLGADQALYEGQHYDQIRQVFVNRGILNPDDAYEPNNELENAFDLREEAAKWISEGAGLGVQSDADWFQVHAGANELNIVVSCEFQHSSGNVDLTLLNGEGAAFDPVSGNRESQSDSNNEMIDCVVPSGGTYYIVVSGADTGTNYDLWWNSIEVAQAPPNNDYDRWLQSQFDLGTLNDSSKELTHWGLAADLDGDGLSTVLEYVFAASPSVPDAHLGRINLEIHEAAGQRYFEFTFRRRLNNSLVEYIPEGRVQGGDWQAGEDMFESLESVPIDHALELARVRCRQALDANSPQLFRLRVRLNVP